MFFADSVELKPFLPNIDAEFEVEDMKNDIEEVDAEIMSLISEELFERLKTNWQTDDLDIYELKVVKYIQVIEANLGYYHFRKLNRVKLSSTGEFRHETDTHQRPMKHEALELQERLLEKGYKAIENLLKILEKNQNEFPEWVESKAFTQFNELLIKTASEFTQYVNINDSRRIFLKIRNIIKEVETFSIKPFLGKSLYAMLKSASETPENIKVLEYLKPALAHLTWAKALKILPINLSAEGYYILEYTGDQSGVTAKMIDKNYISAAIEEAMATGEAYLHDCAQFINANLISYPTFSEGSAYIDPFGSSEIRNNSEDRLFYF